MSTRESNHAEVKSIAFAWIRLLRPKQWAKNAFVFAAALFSGELSHPHAIQLVLLAFVLMCLGSSATYIVNDVFDIERDRLHPTKSKRPLASGLIGPYSAILVSVGLIAASLAMAASLNRWSLIVVIGYLLLQGLYNWQLKRTPIADVYCIALGFILRATLGAAAISVTISPWLLYCTGALALLLGFAKRRHEFILMGEEKASSRESLAQYNRVSLDILVAICACAAAICYGLYTIESHTAKKYPAIILTSLFVFYGITRYLFLVFSQDEGGEPADILLGDRQMMFAVIMFLFTAIAAISGVQLPLLEK